MFNANRNLQVTIIKSVFVAIHIGLVSVGLVSCNAEKQLPSSPTEIQPPTTSPEVPSNQSNEDTDKDDDKQDNDDKDDSKKDND